MRGMMQDRPLLISALIEHAAAHHGDTEIVSRLPDRRILRTSYAEVHERSQRLANALRRLGTGMGDRIATLAWNTHRHLEIYFGVSGLGAVCHTVNPRLFFEQILFICNHAEDQVICFDPGFTELAERLAPHLPSVRHWIALCGRDELPQGTSLRNLLCYEDLLAAEAASFAWPRFDENAASSLCYTSGTTGDPKGVLYSHRSTVLHAYASAMPDSFCLSARDVVMPASSMYHANAWGVPYGTVLVGAKLVLPGAHLDGASLYELTEAEGVTVSCGVPTIWLGMAQHLDRIGGSPRSLRRLIIGGASCPLSLMQAYRQKHGIEVVHLWGMTETSPLGTVNHFKGKHERLLEPQKDELRAKQGRAVFGVEMEIVGDDGHALPHDGQAFGDLLVRGWWIAGGYFKHDKPVLREGGWFPTGDVATLDADGYMRITDRSKDVIKSGGEWISSIDLENAAVGHPAVAEAAVIGLPHPKWDERPLLIICLKDGATAGKGEILDFLRDKVAKWWLPDDIVFVGEIPHTATGKILKTELRRRYAEYFEPPQSQRLQR
jgi:3-(methylthio)propionyl---CoA ligase